MGYSLGIEQRRHRGAETKTEGKKNLWNRELRVFLRDSMPPWFLPLLNLEPSHRPKVRPLEAGEGVAEVGASDCGECLQPGDDLRMLLGYVVLLARIVLQVVERELRVTDDVAVPAGDPGEARELHRSRLHVLEVCRFAILAD